MQKFINTMLIICMIVTMANAQARRIVIEMDHADYSPLLSTTEISIIGDNLTQLLREYIEYSSFQNEEGTYSNEHTAQFLNLFKQDALVYSDLHLSYRELFIDEYVKIVETEFADYGLDATIDYAGLISLKPSIFSNEFIAHLAIDKVNYSKIASSGERIFFKDGQHVRFDMYVQINLLKNRYKISNISNDGAKPIQQVVTNTTKAKQQLKIPAYAQAQIQKTYTSTHVDLVQFARISVGSVFASMQSTSDYSSSISRSTDISAMMYKPLREKSNTYLTLGMSLHKINLATSITNGGVSLLNNDPIAYISTSRGHLLELNEEPNTTKISVKDGEVFEQLDYQRITAYIGINRTVYNKNKLGIYLGTALMPGRLIFSKGERDSQNLSAYKLPNNSSFPSMDVINEIDPEVLNNPSYLIGESGNAPLYDTDRFEISGGVDVMIEYRLLKRMSISSKLSKRFTFWNQRNNLLDNQLSPIIHSSQEPFKINSMLIDVGIILKY